MARTTQKRKIFNGRDYSWMQFNRRVLEEAEDEANPLLERVKFLAITGLESGRIRGSAPGRADAAH
jgi:polyphosphate kinase